MIRRVDCTSATFQRLEDLKARLGLPDLSSALDLCVWAYHEKSVKAPKYVGSKRFMTGTRSWHKHPRKGSVWAAIMKMPRDASFTPLDFVTKKRNEQGARDALIRLLGKGYVVRMIPRRKGRMDVWMINQHWPGHPQFPKAGSEISVFACNHAKLEIERMRREAGPGKVVLVPDELARQAEGEAWVGGMLDSLVPEDAQDGSPGDGQPVDPAE
jgi:hypothetical protein